MGIFATEFPVRNVSKAEFFALAIAWLRGMTHSTLRFDEKSIESYQDELIVVGDEGEKFTLKAIEIGSGFVIGARYDLLDRSGLSWRTECVLTNSDAANVSLRVRVQSFTSSQNVIPTDPKKPYFIKSSLIENWGAFDKVFAVQDQPHYLDESQVEVAASAILGEIETTLPIIYLSVDRDGGYVLDPTKLAYDLGGMAHVVVEPSLKFSAELAKRTERLSPYLGTIGFYDSSARRSVKFYLGGAIDTPRKLESLLRGFVARHCSTKEANLGWEWQELQTQFARNLRHHRTRAPASVDQEWLTYFEESVLAKDEEIVAKEEVIQNLRQKIAILEASLSEGGFGDSIVPVAVSAQIGIELYEGEFSDRVKLFLDRATALEGLDVGPRTLGVARKFAAMVGFSRRAVALNVELKAAGRDYRTSTDQLRSVLERFGYEFAEEGKHIKGLPPSESIGLGQIELPKTPSDYRSGKNSVRDIVKALDFKDLRSDND